MMAAAEAAEADTGWQVTQQVTANLTRFVGRNVQAARFVCDQLGESVHPQFYSCGFKGPGDDCRLFLFSHDARRPRSVFMLVYEAGELPLSRAILATIYFGVFADNQVAEIVTHALAQDLGRREALTRLGFIYIGRENRDGAERVLYSLRCEAIPDLYRRALRRRSS